MILFGNTALLKPVPQADTTVSGIYIAPQYKRDRLQWTVEAVGPGKRRKGRLIPPEIQPGQKCLFNTGLLGVKATLADGRIIVDADLIMMVWN